MTTTIIHLCLSLKKKKNWFHFKKKSRLCNVNELKREREWKIFVKRKQKINIFFRTCNTIRYSSRIHLLMMMMMQWVSETHNYKSLKSEWCLKSKRKNIRTKTKITHKHTHTQTNMEFEFFVSIFVVSTHTETQLM